MWNLSKMAIASAAPSTGSVPDPSSSINISFWADFSLAESCSISMIFTIWDENVDNDCSMLCSSPTSTSTWSNIDISLPSDTGISNPHMLMSVRRPTVFKATVFPPVFGPVTTRVSKSIPSSTSIGTTLSFLISGCLALCSFIFPEVFILGSVACILYAKSAFAYITHKLTDVS